MSDKAQTEIVVTVEIDRWFDFEDHVLVPAREVDPAMRWTILYEDWLPRPAEYDVLVQFSNPRDAMLFKLSI